MKLNKMWKKYHNVKKEKKSPASADYLDPHQNLMECILAETHRFDHISE